MGTIVRRTDRSGKSSFQAKIRRTGFSPMSATFPDKRAAEIWVQETEASMTRGTFVDPTPNKDTTLGALLERYVLEVSPLKKGHAVEAIRIAALKRYPLARAKVSDLNGPMMRAFRDYRLTQVAASTVNRELNVLGHVIETARKEWGVSMLFNPVHDVRRPKNPAPRERRFSEGEEMRLLAACEEARNKWLLPAVILAIETGMRQSEIVTLEWAGVDIARRTIRLRDSKNGEGRGVPLSQRALATLDRLGTGSGRVFVDLTPEALKRAFIRATRRASLKDFHFHDLRHEATSRLFEKGLNIMEAASVTGHKDLRMLRRYTHLDVSKLAERLG